VDTDLQFVSSLLLHVILKDIEQVPPLRWALAGIPGVALNERIGTDFKGPAGLPLERKNRVGRGEANKDALPVLLQAIQRGFE
jgi:hypothetical protein